MTLTTERLSIRPFESGDGDALYAYLSDAETVKFEPYKPFDRESAHSEAERRSKDEHFSAVCLADGELIGNLYCEKGDFDTYEVGYVFNRRYWKHGYASEAVAALMKYIFETLGAHRVIAMCDPKNPNSWRLMERVGMRREAEYKMNVYFFLDDDGKPIWKDTYVYAILRDEYFASSKSCV